MLGAMRGVFANEGYKERAKMKKADFTRERKVGFIALVCIIVNMVRKSSQLEIDEFRERFMPGAAKTTSYTKQSFSEARQKLTPLAFTLLNDAIIQRFYRDDDYKTYRGFRLLAIDGSQMEVPNNDETREAFGYVTNGAEAFKLARALTSHLYDLENKLVISATISRYDAGERELAKANIENMATLMPFASHVQNLVLFDRGYPSIGFISYLMTTGIRFVMRVSTGFLREVTGTTKPDETLNVSVNRARAKELRRQGTPLPVGTAIKLRVLRVELPAGEIEVLITDLSADELPYDESKSLYFRRWGIETRFNDLKHKFEIENLSGEKPLIVEQDFHATILLSNLASCIEQDAQEELEKSSVSAARKYDEYRINTNILVGKLKFRLIEVILEDNRRKQNALYKRLVAELTRNIVPVILGRSFPRRKANQANKYSTSKRRCL